MGFPIIPADREFALLSAQYLTRRGLHRPQIVAALVDQLEIDVTAAIAIVDEAVAASHAA